MKTTKPTVALLLLSLFLLSGASCSGGKEPQQKGSVTETSDMVLQTTLSQETVEPTKTVSQTGISEITNVTIAENGAPETVTPNELLLKEELLPFSELLPPLEKLELPLAAWEEQGLFPYRALDADRLLLCFSDATTGYNQGYWLYHLETKELSKLYQAEEKMTSATVMNTTPEAVLLQETREDGRRLYYLLDLATLELRDISQSFPGDFLDMALVKGGSCVLSKEGDSTFHLVALTLDATPFAEPIALKDSSLAQYGIQWLASSELENWPEKLQALRESVDSERSILLGLQKGYAFTEPPIFVFENGQLYFWQRKQDAASDAPFEFYAQEQDKVLLHSNLDPYSVYGGMGRLISFAGAKNDNLLFREGKFYRIGHELDGKYLYRLQLATDGSLFLFAGSGSGLNAPKINDLDVYRARPR